MTEAIVAEPHDAEVRALHRRLLERWNARDAAGFAALVADDGLVIGFDGSDMTGPVAIASSLGSIFAKHRTPAYVAKVRSVRLLGSGAAVLHAVAGMLPEGKAEVNPAVNAVQVLVAVRLPAGWRIAVFQNTPAAYHGRPERAAELTAELQQFVGRAPA